MITTIHALRLLAIVLWVGGLLFFAFVLAPTAFHVLPSTHEAGLVVGGTLVILHRIAVLCGIVFLAATALLWMQRQSKLYVGQILLVALMLAITLYLQQSILPRMEADRTAVGGDIDAAASDNPGRLDFERLHPLSERFEGAALFAGLGVVLLMAAEPHSLKTVN